MNLNTKTGLGTRLRSSKVVGNLDFCSWGNAVDPILLLADDEEDDDEEEEEEEEAPPPPQSSRSGGRQKAFAANYELDANASDADSDGETVILPPRRSPPRRSKSWRSRRTCLPRRMLEPIPPSAASRPAETDTDSGLVSSSSCSSSAVETPGEETPVRPARTAGRKTDTAIETSMRALKLGGASMDDGILASQTHTFAL